MKSRASMAAEVRLPVCETLRATARAPGVAGLGAVGVGGGVAHGLERVAPVAQDLRSVRHQLELAGLHLGAVLRALEVAELGREPVDAAVESPHLRVEGVDEAPEQALALVGELEAVGCDAFGDDAERLARPRPPRRRGPRRRAGRTRRARGLRRRAARSRRWSRSLTVAECRCSRCCA